MYVEDGRAAWRTSRTRSWPRAASSPMRSASPTGPPRLVATAPPPTPGGAMARYRRWRVELEDEGATNRSRASSASAVGMHSLLRR